MTGRFAPLIAAVVAALGAATATAVGQGDIIPIDDPVTTNTRTSDGSGSGGSGGGTETTPARRRSRQPIDRQVRRALRTARSAERRAKAAVTEASKSVPGPAGFPGEVGPPGATGATGRTGDPGAPSSSPIDGSMPSGVTVTGSWYARFRRPATGQYELTASLPARAPVALGDENVVFGPGSGFVSVNEEHPSRCTGSLDAPTTSPGFVCLYVDPAALLNVQPNSGLSGEPLDPAGGPSEANRHGFTVLVQSPSTGLVTPTNEVHIGGTWAYTSP